MERICIVARTTKTNGDIKLRFRLIDGREIQLYHKSDIMASMEDIRKFNADGSVKPRVSIYNRRLHESITKEITLVRNAYLELRNNGVAITSDNLEGYIERMRNEEGAPVVDKTFISRFKKYVEEGYRDGIFGLSRYKHDLGTVRKLERFLQIHHLSVMAYDEWNADLLMKFRQFVQDEYNFVDQYPEIYGEINRRDIPKEKRKANSVANEMQVLKSFFNELVDMEEIQRSPFSKISREKRKAITRKKYDAPVYLRKEEFKTLRELSPKKTLAETHEAFLLHCALGCRIGDFQNMTMENVGVSEDGIPYIHYLPQKTRETQNDNKEIVTPLVRFAFEIIKKTLFNLPILKYPSGKSGYNKKIKELLKQAGIDRLVAEYDEETGTNKYIPLYEAASSKLARKTMVDMMSKVQVNLYAAGLHREGSDAVNRYTQLEIKDRFSLMNTAFGEKEYKVDKYLNVIE